VRKKAITTSIWDASNHLETDEDVILYLEAALEENDPELISAALGDVARAKGMAQIAEKTGLGRTSLYKALSPDGHPEFETVLKVMDALGLKFCIAPIKT
jgi:probable addiction module antidote protein